MTRSPRRRCLAVGLARCAGCGHTLKITGNTDRKRGTRYPVYYCTGRYATGLCESRANARASLVDQYVEEQVHRALEAEDGLRAQAIASSEKVEEASRAVAEAEHELDLFVNNLTLMSLIGEQKFVEGVEVRQRALDETRRALTEVSPQSQVAEELSDCDLSAAWPKLTVVEKRRLMHGLLDRVVITRATSRGRHAGSVGKRIEIVFRGTVLLSPTEDAQNGSA